MLRCRVFAAIVVLGMACTSGAWAAEPAPDSIHPVNVQRGVKVPMRDGVLLAADIYRPLENERPVKQKLPAVLMRTPYGKSSWGDKARFFAQYGYLSVVQDCRGRGESEGVFFPFRDEPQDGADTIAWLAKHPECNGRVAMHGASYMAWVQFHAAAMNPPGLATIVPHQGPTNAYHYSMRCGGALHLGLLRWVLSVAASSQEARLDPAAAADVRAMMTPGGFLEWTQRIPWERGKTPLARLPAYEEAAFQLYFDNYDYNDFWRQPGLAMDQYFHSFPNMPILWVASWFDWYPRTISDGYQKMLQMKRKNQYLLVGPWSHNNFRTTVGDADFGNAGGRISSYQDFLQMERTWFDRWLKDDATIDLGPPVKFFMMGGGDGRRGPSGLLNHGGQWIETDAWPPRGTIPTEFYLLRGGRLTTSRPKEHAASSAYVCDPKNTVSSNGRCIIAYGPAASSGFAGMGPRDQIDLETLPGHGYPGRPIVERPDVLAFQTPPLRRDVRIAGNICVRLWVSSDAPDTDFFVKLVDVYPPGQEGARGYGFPVSEGILRARYRYSFENPTPMAPGEVYRLEFPLEPAANRFAAGHSIQVYICSSNFPNFDINRNTGDLHDHSGRPARNTIHHDREHPSAIVLPLWPTPNDQ